MTATVEVAEMVIWLVVVVLAWLVVPWLGWQVPAHPALLQTCDSSSYYTNSTCFLYCSRSGRSKYQCLGCFGEG